MRKHECSFAIIFLFAAIIFCILLVAAELYFISAASAAAPIDAVSDKFKQVLESGTLTQFMLEQGKRLFYWLALIQFSWNMIKMLTEGNHDLYGLVMAVTRTILSIGIMLLLLDSSVEYFGMIIDSFRQMGEAVGGPLQISSLVNMSSEIVNSIYQYLWDTTNGFTWLACVIMAIIPVTLIFICFSTVILTALLAQCKTYISASIAVYLTGFGGCDYTKNIAITAYKAVLSASVELFVIYVLLGVGNELFQNFLTDATTGEGLDVMMNVFSILIAAIVYAGCVKTLPQFISGIINGSSAGGASTAGMASAASSIGGALAAGGLAIAGGAVGAYAGAKGASGGLASKIGQGMIGSAKGSYGGGTGAIGRMARQGGESHLRSAYDLLMGKNVNNLTPGGNTQGRNSAPSIQNTPGNSNVRPPEEPDLSGLNTDK